MHNITAYRIEISLAILLKLIALFFLWQLFFSHSEKVNLDQEKLHSHYLKS